MFGILLGVAFTIGEVFMVTNIYRSWTWHHRGAGAHAAHIEYARIRCEQPDTAEARLSEDEFARYYVATRPGAAPYAMGALLLALVAGVIAYAAGAFGDMP